MKSLPKLVDPKNLKPPVIVDNTPPVVVIPKINLYEYIKCIDIFNLMETSNNQILSLCINIFVTLLLIGGCIIIYQIYISRNDGITLLPEYFNENNNSILNNVYIPVPELKPFNSLDTFNDSKNIKLGNQIFI